MNWKQILTEHTKPADKAGEYVQTKAMDSEIYSEAYRDADNWRVCAVGSFMQDRIDNWNDVGQDAQGDALSNLQTDRDIQLYRHGKDFFYLIKEGDIAGARKCYEDIESIVNRMDDSDIGALADFLHDSDWQDYDEYDDE